jgi:uncharacterized protein YjiS (DUF1127 family)
LPGFISLLIVSVVAAISFLANLFVLFNNWRKRNQLTSAYSQMSLA